MAFQAEHSVSRITATAWPVDSHAPTGLIEVKNSYFWSGRSMRRCRKEQRLLSVQAARINDYQSAMSEKL